MPGGDAPEKQLGWSLALPLVFAFLCVLCGLLFHLPYVFFFSFVPSVETVFVFSVPL